MSKSIDIHFYFNDEFATALVQAFGESTCAKIRQHWRDFSQDASPFRFTVDAVDGSALPEEGLIEELYPSQQSLIIYVHRSMQKKRVRIFSTQQEPVEVDVLPQDTTQSLTERIKALLSIEEGRVARLLVGGRVLTAKAAPHAQLANCAVVELDLRCQFTACYLEAMTFQPELCDGFGRFVIKGDLSYLDGCDGSCDQLALPAYSKGPEQRTLHLFASEPARALTGVGKWRVSACRTGKSIPSDEAVCALMTNEALLNGTATDIFLERCMKVQIWDKLRSVLKTVTAWPTEKLGNFRTNICELVMMDGDTLDPHQSLWEAGLQDDSCLCITRLIPLIIHDENGIEMKVTADLGESLTQLLERLGFADPRYELWGDGKVVTDRQYSLFYLKIESYCSLKVLPMKNPPAYITFRRLPGSRYQHRNTHPNNP